MYERNPGEYAHKIKVLVNVPKDEYDKVQAWKQQRAAFDMFRNNKGRLDGISTVLSLFMEEKVCG